MAAEPYREHIGFNVGVDAGKGQAKALLHNESGNYVVIGCKVSVNGVRSCTRTQSSLHVRAQATPHAVRGAQVAGVSRETFAIFMEPE